MSAIIATVRGELHLTIGKAEPVYLGYISIPIETETSLDREGRLILTASPRMSEVRDLITEVFAQEADQ